MKQYEYLMSACLCNVHCRYDGTTKPSNTCQLLYEQGKVLLICPEVMGGLPTPRLSSEIVETQVFAADGSEVSRYFISGAEQAAAIARMFGIKKAILKEYSPSCGVHHIYDGSFSGRKISGQGICAEKLKEAGIEVISDEEAESCTIWKND